MKPYMLEQLKPDYDNLPDKGILSQALADTDEQKTILFHFAEGQYLSEHTAAVPAMLYFVDGDCEVTLGDDKADGSAGTWAYMEANLPHSILAKTNATVLLVMFKKGS